MVDPKSIRDRLGWSQERMAEHLGCDQATVSRMERTRKISGPILRLYQRLDAEAPAPVEAAPAGAAA